MRGVCVLPPPNWVISVRTGAVFSVLPERRRRTMPECSVSARGETCPRKELCRIAVVLWRDSRHYLL